MNNYYNFNFKQKYFDRDTIKFYKSLSSKDLKVFLNESFNYIEYFLNYFSNVFKQIYKGKDDDEFYYTCQSLIEELHDVKIILNILKEREK